MAVALSHHPVGVDIEPANRVIKPALAKKVLTPDEHTTYDALPATEQNDYLLRAWVSKEAIYKRTGQGSFCPAKIALDANATVIQTIKLGMRSFAVALSCDAGRTVQVCVLDVI